MGADDVRTVLWIGLIELLTLSGPAWSDESPQFDRDVAPLLKRHCVKCHGPAKQEAKLNLAAAGGLIRGGESGTSLVPHDADASLIWQKINANEMPPEAPLSAEEKSLVKRWIVEGTPGLKQADTDVGDHWAFRPLEPSLWHNPAAETTAATEAAVSPVDRFLLWNLAQDGLSYLPEVDRYTQIRRVSLDLLGLPPTPAAIDQFISDTSPDAYSRMVDRFLASPHFGERLGKLWLDAAGYADSNGYFNADTDRPLAHRYRDYVIRSLNADKPFDEFIREQIAGDELSSVTARTGETVVLPATSIDGSDAAGRVMELWEATHFLRNGQDGTGESDGNSDEVRVDRYTVIETAMQNISTSVLGLTIQCAKCHDHKFEPLTQRDYYSFQAVLIPAFPPSEWKKPNERFVYATRPGEMEAWQSALNEIETTITGVQSEVDAWAKSNRPHGTILFQDDFNGPSESLLAGWSHTAPGDDQPGGTAAVHLNSREAPAAIIDDGRLQVIEGGPGGDKWLSTKNAFDWTPDMVGASIQVTFDLVANQIEQSPPAERIGYFFALHDFHNDSPIGGGNILVDGHPSSGTAVVLDYPGASSKPLGTLGKTGYVPGRNYGIRITNLGKDKYQLQQLVDWQVDEPAIKLKAEDLPPGGFGFEYCCGRSFVVDNVVIETFTPSERSDPLAAFSKELGTRREPLDAALKTKDTLTNSRPGKIAWTTDIVDRPPPVHLLERGNYAAPGPLVEPAGFAVLGGTAASTPVVTASGSSPERIVNLAGAELKSSGRRLAFANWLTAPDSKPASLMARVQVNRFWQHHFGTGLVATADNFGLSGPVPSHRELLDWLAAEFIRSGWSSKHVVRLIVNSDAYRQSSQRSSPNGESTQTLAAHVTNTDDRNQRDPDARRLSRFPVRRLDAEEIRDMLLFSSGDFDDRLYGPYIPTTRTDQGETIVAEDNPGVRRRSIYLQQKRTQVHSLLQVFDAPSIVFNSTRRARSTMPLQSLSLMNSEFVVARSQHLTHYLQQDFVSDSERLQQAFVVCTGRPPTEADIRAAMKFLHEQTKEYGEQSDAQFRAWADLCQMLLIENAALYVD